MIMKFGTMRLEIARNPGYHVRQLINFEGRCRADRQLIKLEMSNYTKQKVRIEMKPYI